MGTSSAQKHEAGKKSKFGKNGASNRGKKIGQGALKAGTGMKHSNAASKAGRTTPGGDTRVRTPGSHMRTEGTIKRLQMYTAKAPNREKMREQKLAPMRIQPDRRWFGNTRVIAQEKMQAFRETIAKGVADPFSVVLKSSKLPMSLLRDTEGKSSRMDLLQVSPFNEVFGKKRQQKRVKLSGLNDLEGLVEAADKKTVSYASGSKDSRSSVDAQTGLDKPDGDTCVKGHAGEEIFNKGTSRRIWCELYKVVDSSDILIFVLDARDPNGTRCLQLERELRKNRAHKHVILLINKVDLVPTWVSRKWISQLMKDFPTLAFHASITNPFGKNSLLNLLRQFGSLMKDKKHITVGMIGYPNVGKSSVINTLKRKKVCKAAPVPGETRVWQYIALTKRIYLLDCPGIVPPSAADFEQDCAKVLKGVVRAERIKTPTDYIGEVLTRVKKLYLLQRYKLPAETQWEDAEEFLTILAKKMGKLHRGGEADLDTVARVVLYDWQRGRIPFFVAPPEDDLDEPEEEDAAEGKGSADAADAEGTEQKAAAMEIAKKSLAGLNEIGCSHIFDDEDRRGEAVGSGLSSATSSAKKAMDNGGSSSSSKRAAPKEEAAPTAGKKKPRRGGGGERKETGLPGANGADWLKSGGKQSSNLGQPGSVDWKAVVAEFGE